MMLPLLLAASLALPTASAPPAAVAPQVASDWQIEQLNRGEPVFRQAGVMAEEMEEAFRLAGGDEAQGRRDMEAIAARYQPMFDAYADELQAATAPIIASGPAAERAEKNRVLEESVQFFRRMPAWAMELILEDAAEAKARAEAEATMIRNPGSLPQETSVPRDP